MGKKGATKAKAPKQENVAAAQPAKEAPAPAKATPNKENVAPASKNQKKNNKKGKREDPVEEVPEEEPEPVVEEMPSAPAPAATETATGKKGKKAKKVEPKLIDWNDVEEQAKRERNARIIQRICNMLIFGLFMNSGTEEKKSQNVEVRKQKKSYGGGEEINIGRKMEDYKPIFYTIIIVFFVALLRMGEDSYNPYMQRDADAMNPYEVMGVSTSATQGDIKKAYRGLSLQFHPDKNPECTTCAEKFGKISEANDILSNPAKRNAWDNNLKTDGKLFETTASLVLNRNLWEKEVVRSNEVWMIMVYNAEESHSEQIFPFWDDLATNAAHHFKFGHLDAASADGKKLLDRLPIRAVMFPTVFRISRDFGIDVAPMYQLMSKTELSKWAYSVLPDTLYQITEEHELETWLKTPVSDPAKFGKMLIVAEKKESTSRPQLPGMRRNAIRWRDYFEFAQINPTLAPERLKVKRPSFGATVEFIDANGDEEKNFILEVKDFKKPAEMDGMVDKIISSHVPEVDQVNYRRMCGSNLSSEVRKYCLCLVDPNKATVAAAQTKLKESKDNYEKEQKELAEGDDDFVAEEPFEIQIVAIRNNPGSFSAKPNGAHTWATFWSQAPLAYGNMFLFEDATERGRSLANLPGDLSELHSLLALEDFKLQETGPLAPHLPDPMLTVVDDVRGTFFGSAPRLLLSIVILVFLAAFIPEADSQQFCGLAIVFPFCLILSMTSVLWKSILGIF